MHGLLLQVATDGFRFDPAWVVAGIAIVVTTLSSTVAVLYRANIVALRERIVWLEGELKARDENSLDREGRLMALIGRTADLGERSVSLVERGTRR